MGDLDILFQGHVTLEITEIWHRLALGCDKSPPKGVNRFIWGWSRKSLKIGDLDLIVQGHVPPEMTESVTDWLWCAISRNQTDIAFSNSSIY